MLKNVKRIGTISILLFVLSQALIGAAMENIVISTESKTVIAGQTFDINISVDPKGSEVAGMQARLVFDPVALRLNSVTEGNLFSQYDTYSRLDQPEIISMILGNYNISSPGTFIKANFTALGASDTSIGLENVKVASPDGVLLPLYIMNGTVTVLSNPKYDLNGDGIMDIEDLIIVAQHSGEVTTEPYPYYDVNQDGIVNIFDIVLVSQHLEIIPLPAPAPTITITPTLTPTSEPTPEMTPTPEPTPALTPEPTITETPTPTPTPEPTPEKTPKPKKTPRGKKWLSIEDIFKGWKAERLIAQ